MSPTPRVTILPSSQLDDTARAHLIALANDAFLTHAWLFPHGERTDPETFAEETAGADLILVHDPTAPGSPDSPVAMALIHPDEHDPTALYLGMVAVPRALHRRGYGTAIIHAAESEALRRRLTRITLTTIPELGNTTYYERKGYTTISTDARPAGTWGSTAPFTLAHMSKTLL